jgi:hypothetical protein
MALSSEVTALRKSGFRKDLFYRLAGAVLTLPALREQNSSVIVDFATKMVWPLLQKVDPTLELMGVTPAGIDYIKEMYLNRADEHARAYQEGNFRSLRNLMHRAALQARASNSTNVDEPHLVAAERDGVIPDSIDVALNQRTHIREVFWNGLHEQLGSEKLKSYSLERFGLADLKEWTTNCREETALAFLRCNLVQRMVSSKRAKYYELREIETALATGYGRGAWIGYCLKPEYVGQAAANHIMGRKYNYGGKTVSAIVKDVQKNRDRISTEAN